MRVNTLDGCLNSLKGALISPNSQLDLSLFSIYIHIHISTSLLVPINTSVSLEAVRQSQAIAHAD